MHSSAEVLRPWRFFQSAVFKHSCLLLSHILWTSLNSYILIILRRNCQGSRETVCATPSSSLDSYHLYSRSYLRSTINNILLHLCLSVTNNPNESKRRTTLTLLSKNDYNNTKNEIIIQRMRLYEVRKCFLITYYFDVYLSLVIISSGLLWSSCISDGYKVLILE